MFFDNFLGALLGEAVALLIWRSYEKKSPVVLGSALFMVLTVPLSLPFSIWFNGTSIERFRSTALWQTGLVFLGVIALSILGAFLGLKIAGELQKAGKLRPYDEQ